MFPVVHPMGIQSKMRGDSEERMLEKCGSTADNDESFLPPIDSRWSTASGEGNDEIGFNENDDDSSSHCQGSVQSRRPVDKKLSKSGRFIVNKSSMSDSFVLPNIAGNHGSPDGIRKSRTAGSNWSHGEAPRSRNGFPISKSCPILKNRNGYYWGKDSSEEDDDDDFDGDFLSMSYNVMMQSERDGQSHNDADKRIRLAKLETNAKLRKSNTKGANAKSKVSSLGETKLPDIFSQDCAPRLGPEDGNNNEGRRRTRKDHSECKAREDINVADREMDYELDVSPWRGEGNQDICKNKDVAMVVEGGGVRQNEMTAKPKAKRKAGNQKLPISSKNPESKCREWLQDH